MQKFKVTTWPPPWQGPFSCMWSCLVYLVQVKDKQLSLVYKFAGRKEIEFQQMLEGHTALTESWLCHHATWYRGGRSMGTVGEKRVQKETGIQRSLYTNCLFTGNSSKQPVPPRTKQGSIIMSRNRNWNPNASIFSSIWNELNLSLPLLDLSVWSSTRL